MASYKIAPLQIPVWQIPRAVKYIYNLDMIYWFFNYLQLPIKTKVIFKQENSESGSGTVF